MSRPTRGPTNIFRIRGYHPLRPAFPDRSAACSLATGLLHFRSPLLAESLLMSFPPGTEMFQFPGFAPPTYEFSRQYPKGVGCPIRISTDQSLLAAPRGFSQRATSFIASWCQGIHRMPFSCAIRHPAQEPTPNQRPPPMIMVVQAQDGRSCQSRIITHASARSTSFDVAPSAADPPHPFQDGDSVGQTSRHGRGLAPTRSIHPHARMTPERRRWTTARPETHQNLIHTTKEHRRPTPFKEWVRRQPTAHARSLPQGMTATMHRTCFPRIPHPLKLPTNQPPRRLDQEANGWRRTGSNR